MWCEMSDTLGGGAKGVIYWEGGAKGVIHWEGGCKRSDTLGWGDAKGVIHWEERC